MKKTLFMMMPFVLALFAGMPLTANAQQQKTGEKRTTTVVKTKKAVKTNNSDENKGDTIVFRGDYALRQVIYYPAPGQNWIKKDEIGKIREFADYLRKHPDCKAIIEGYSYEENYVGKESIFKVYQGLSDARAVRVKKMLIQNYKIDESRITTKGFGNRVQPFRDSLEKNRCAIVYAIP